MLTKGQVIELENKTEGSKGVYVVIDTVEAYRTNYIYLMKIGMTYDIMIANKMKLEGEFKLTEIKDNAELEYSLAILEDKKPSEEPDDLDLMLEDIRDRLRKNTEVLENSIKDTDSYLDKNELLMQQYTRRNTGVVVGSYEQYMAGDTTPTIESTINLDDINFNYSIKKYILTDKNKEYLVGRLVSNVSQELSDSIGNKFKKSASEMVNGNSEIFAEFQESDKVIEFEEPVKRLAA